eukprot:CAMPEP_0179450690 /NCGR_PEP_ID=MMETSP0799-20121207/34674_1 /TAXON_ID=46947 /ORGANISM="Geminigera cryophila, Strain CCMP2564" /LENGTH=98 /DNA_ID=CAMNT_0021245061 /DNA_START=158 /DNA_END=452 /DNA_ORIENTATION=+
MSTGRHHDDLVSLEMIHEPQPQLVCLCVVPKWSEPSEAAAPHAATSCQQQRVQKTKATITAGKPPYISLQAFAVAVSAPRRLAPIGPIAHHPSSTKPR